MFALPLSITAAVLAVARNRGAKVMAVVALVASMAPIGLGVFGMVVGRARVDAILQSGMALSLSPTDIERVREEGYAEANGCLTVGFALGALPLVFAFVAAAMAFGQKSQNQPGG